MHYYQTFIRNYYKTTYKELAKMLSVSTREVQRNAEFLNLKKKSELAKIAKNIIKDDMRNNRDKPHKYFMDKYNKSKTYITFVRREVKDYKKQHIKKLLNNKEETNDTYKKGDYIDQFKVIEEYKRYYLVYDEKADMMTTIKKPVCANGPFHYEYRLS
jgi:L-rhamnose isomerase